MVEFQDPLQVLAVQPLDRIHPDLPLAPDHRLVDVLPPGFNNT